MVDRVATVACNGTTLHYREVGHGDGPPLVFIPGLGSGFGMFEPQVAAFAQRRRLILPDLRGNAGSGRLSGPIATILDRQCDDIAALFDHLNIDRGVMIGVSYGGVVALHFALRHPGRLAAMVVADTFADIDRSRPIELGFWIISYVGLIACYLPKPLMRLGLRLAYGRWPAAKTAIPALAGQFRSTEAILQSLAMNAVNYPPRLGAVRCPTLGIVGGLTRTGVRFMERAMTPIPGARLEVVANSFDPSNLCQPDVFNRLVDEFLIKNAL